MFIVFLDDEGSRGDRGTRNAQVRHRGFLKIGRKRRTENVLHDRGYTKNRRKLPKVIAFDWLRKYLRAGQRTRYAAREGCLKFVG